MSLVHSVQLKGLFRELDPGPLAPEAIIIPLDQTAGDLMHAANSGQEVVGPATCMQTRGGTFQVLSPARHASGYFLAALLCFPLVCPICARWDGRGYMPHLLCRCLPLLAVAVAGRLLLLTVAVLGRVDIC